VEHATRMEKLEVHTGNRPQNRRDKTTRLTLLLIPEVSGSKLWH